MFKTTWLLFVLTAIALSYSVNESICWALLHAICGPFYAIFWLIKYAMLSEGILRAIGG